MNTKALKMVAVATGIVSIIYAAYFLVVAISIIRMDGHFDIGILTGNTTFTYLFLSPLSAFGLFISSFGLYREAKWGHIVSNIFLLIFIGGFILVVANNYFPNLFDSSVQLKSGWFVFYHMKLSWDTVLVPVVAAALCIVLNISSTRRLFYK